MINDAAATYANAYFEINYVNVYSSSSSTSGSSTTGSNSSASTAGTRASGTGVSASGSGAAQTSRAAGYKRWEGTGAAWVGAALLGVVGGVAMIL